MKFSVFWYAIDGYGNPFLEESSDLLILDKHKITDRSIVNSLHGIEKLGCEPYNTFVQECLVECTKPMHDVIKNKLPLFSTPPTCQKMKAQELMAALKSDCYLFSRLYVACQAHDGNLEEFFHHENQTCPPSLLDRGKLRQGTKSDIVQCLGDSVTEKHSSQDAKVVVLDGHAIVHMLKHGAAKTFQEYAKDVFLPYVNSKLERAQRVDVIWDYYRSGSLKAQTRERKGKGIHQRVDSKNAVAKNWQELLRLSDIKKELFSFLSREVVNIQTKKQGISTLNENVVCHHTINT